MSTALAKDPVTVELHTFIAHCDTDSRGISCVVTNNSKRVITVLEGFDGEKNELLSRGLGFPISLRPAKKTEPKPVKVEPGLSHTVFSLPIDGIFLLWTGEEPREWGWGWHGSPPRGAPPMSPVHSSYRLGWELGRADSATVSAAVTVDGETVSSQSLEIKVPPLRTEPVKVLVRMKSGSWKKERTPRYEIVLEVRKSLQGKLSAEECTLRLPDGQAEHVMAAGEAKLKEGMYTFPPADFLFEFERVLPEGRRPAVLVLRRYERKK